MNQSIKLPVPQGWQCPVCDKVNAPFVRECTCHIMKQTIPGSTSTTGISNFNPSMIHNT